jgi:hypothetical protein
MRHLYTPTATIISQYSWPANTVGTFHRGRYGEHVNTGATVSNLCWLILVPVPADSNVDFIANKYILT